VSSLQNPDVDGGIKAIKVMFGCFYPAFFVYSVDGCVHQIALLVN
jgi:hypothetical protein